MTREREQGAGRADFVQLLDKGNCPVEELAVEAAKIVRTMGALVEREELEAGLASESPDLRDLVESEEESSKMRLELRSLLRALASLARFRTARSVKGAVFQIYLALELVDSMNLDQQVAPAVQRNAALERQQAIADLSVSALAVLEAAADDDLRVLKKHFVWEEGNAGRQARTRQALEIANRQLAA